LSKKKFKIILESDKVITTKSEIFVGKCFYYNNMFEYWWNQYYLYSYDWIYFFFLHGRLGYLIFKYLKYMCKYDYISYQQDNNNKCQVYIQVKMTKKTFFKLKKIMKYLN